MADPLDASQIAASLGVTFTSAQEELCDLVIESAIGEIEDYLGRPVTIREFSENVVIDANGAAYFRNTPVVSIEEMTVNGEVVADPGDYVTVTPYGIDNVWLQSLPLESFSSGSIDRSGFYGATVSVTYTAGFDFPPGVRSLVLWGARDRMKMVLAAEAQAGMGSEMAALRSIKVEDYEVEFASGSAGQDSGVFSSLPIFGSEAAFGGIKRLKRPGVL